MREKLLQLISSLDTLEDIEYLEEKIKHTYKINRRTTAGRELTERLLRQCNQQALKIIKEKQIIPF